MINVETYLQEVLSIASPLAPLDMPLLDAHGATLATDVYAGERLVLRGGGRIRATHIGLAASIGLDHLPTRPHPRVVVISAGEDLTEPGHVIDERHTYEANSWLLTTAVREAEAIGYRVHTIPDTDDELKSLIEDQLVRADLVVMSSGPRSVEMMRRVLAELGEINERELEMDPSGHHSYGLIGPDKTPVITLPSDALMAYISCELFVRPMIRQMLGRKTLSHRVLTATLETSVTSVQGRQTFHQATISRKNEVLYAAVVDGALQADSNGFIIVDEKATELKVGSEVSVIYLESRSD